MAGAKVSCGRRVDAGQGAEPSGWLRDGCLEGRRTQSEEDWGRLAVRLQGTGSRGDGKIG